MTTGRRSCIAVVIKKVTGIIKIREFILDLTRRAVSFDHFNIYINIIKSLNNLINILTVS
jgi:hypothetical protein